MNTINLLNSVSEIVDNRGKTCPTSKTGIALIATNCIKSRNLFPTKERIRFVSQDTYNNWFRGHPQPGDILFVNKGSPGEVCLVPDDVDFCVAQDMVALRANKQKIDPLYLFAVLRSKRIKNMIENMHVGTMIPHFKKSDFKKINLPLPNRGVQEFIGNFYYSFSKKIDLNEKVNQTFAEFAKTLFKSWFVDFDPVRTKLEGRPTDLPNEISKLFPDSYEDSELGKIPKGWELKKLGSILTFLSSGNRPKGGASKSENQIPSIGAENINFLGNYQYSNEKFVPFEFFKKLKEKNLEIKDYDILIYKDGANIGRSTMFGKGFPHRVCTINEHVFILRSHEHVQKFLYFYLSSSKFQNKLISLNTASAQPGINKKSLNNIDILMPKKEVLERFDQTISAMVDKIFNNCLSINILSKLRDSLLPKLISGELSIYDVEKIIDETSV